MAGCSVEFVVWGPKVDPDELTRRLLVDPTASVRVGDLIGPYEYPSEIGGWRYAVESESASTANELARRLLDRFAAVGTSAFPDLRRAHEVEIRFVFRIDPAETFSFELDPDVAERLAWFGAPLAFRFDDQSGAAPEAFASAAAEDDQIRLELGVFREGLDPSAVTADFGLEPTMATPGLWRFGAIAAAPADVNALARDLVEKLPAAGDTWQRWAREATMGFRFVFIVPGLTGHFGLDSDVVWDLGTRGCGINVTIYDRRR